ncbi:MAG: LacI family DNA-binding transcriptional regulator [Hyphomicrobiaceae bacterium]
MARKVLRAGLPSITDVAVLAGVSVATVSRYFNAPERVKSTTRESIAKAVSSLGYVPHAVRALDSQGSGTIGLIVPTIDTAIFSEMIQEFSTTLFRHARTTLIAAHGYDLDQEAILVESLIGQRVDALAIVGTEHSQETLDQLDRATIPIVVTWSFKQDLPWPCVGVDNVEAGRLAMEHLLNLGHRDILLLLTETRANDRTSDRQSGAFAALSAFSVDVSDHRKVVCPYDIQRSKDLTIGALSSRPRPTAIFAINDVIAQGASFAAAALGLSIPTDLSIVGIGDFRGSSAMEPGITTVRIPAQRIGAAAAGVLVAMLDAPNSTIDRSQQLKLEFNIRGSTAPLAMLRKEN